MKQCQDYFGRMNDATTAAFLKGPCGDEMEFYLLLEDDRIAEIRFYTEGCEATKECGAAAAALARGKTLQDALSISAGDVMEELQDLPADHIHCSILAVSTLYRAIAGYLLRSTQ
ncbi:MAG: iron-sulfur cluster assembly scaffold protein [Candidatus Omnitrophica bacterium]|nr:iron-sulfur cluster assembly scaffold protein [Candidatus Omnitrophota bacterium]